MSMHSGTKLDPICEIPDGRVRLIRGKCLFRETCRKFSKLRRRMQQCEEEDKVDAAKEERIRVRRKEREDELIKLWAHWEELAKTMRGLRGHFGDALDGDMEMEDGVCESDETNGENNMYGGERH